jgi:ribosomal protein S18 acetylase RimI-like enzyme
MAPPRGLLLLARLDGEPVGCGVLWHHGGGVADAKRMWVAPRARGLGLGRRLLAELEEHARAAGVRSLRLDTNRALTEAIGLYRAAGYEEVGRFNDEPHADFWFAKPLG